MAGARPSSFKRGGSRIFTGDATILDYTINDTFNGKPYDPKDLNPTTRKPRFHWLYVHLTARFDGASDPSEKSFSLAGADDWVVAENGKTIVPNSPDQQLGSSAGWSTLIDSLCAAGFNESLLPADKVNFEALVGARVKFGTRKNERLAKEGKKQVNRKTGKSYDYEDIVVEQFYGFEQGTKAAAAATTTSVEALAESTLQAILAKSGGAVKKSALTLAVLQAMPTHPQRDPVRTLLGTDAFLDGLSSVVYDRQTGMIASAVPA